MTSFHLQDLLSNKKTLLSKFPAVTKSENPSFQYESLNRLPFKDRLKKMLLMPENRNKAIQRMESRIRMPVPHLLEDKYFTQIHREIDGYIPPNIYDEPHYLQKNDNMRFSGKNYPQGYMDQFKKFQEEKPFSDQQALDDCIYYAVDKLWAEFSIHKTVMDDRFEELKLKAQRNSIFQLTEAEEAEQHQRMMKYTFPSMKIKQTYVGKKR